MNLPAGMTCLYNPAMDTYTFVYADGSQIKFTRLELQQMTHPGLNSYTGLGGLHGGYRTPTQATHSSSSNGANPGDTGTQAQLAAAQQAANFANLYPGGLTYSSTSGMISGFGYQCLLPAQEQLPIVKYEGIKSGEIIAYRCWIIKGNVLHSTYTDTPWNPDKPMTGDVGGDDGYAVGCGIHAFKEEHKAREYAQIYSCPWNVVVLGKVKLWGEVVEHERGYRAENARVMSLDEVICPVYGGERILRSIRKRYGVNEYANGNDTGNGKRGSETEQTTGQDQEFRGNNLSGISSNPRKGGYWGIIRNFLQR